MTKQPMFTAVAVLRSPELHLHVHSTPTTFRTIQQVVVCQVLPRSVLRACNSTSRTKNAFVQTAGDVLTLCAIPHTSHTPRQYVSLMDEVASMSLSQLRKAITAAGLGHDDCLEKSELQTRAREALAAASAPPIGRFSPAGRARPPHLE